MSRNCFATGARGPPYHGKPPRNSGRDQRDRDAGVMRGPRQRHARQSDDFSPASTRPSDENRCLSQKKGQDMGRGKWLSAIKRLPLNCPKVTQR